jgi:hypothetical protein
VANTLRIKRRPIGGAAGAPTSLAASEIAYNEQDDILYYGKGDSGGNAISIIPIGGPGAFTPIGGGGGGPATITTSDTPPASPTNGSLWWESDTGTLYMSYNDGTSTQWVAVGGPVRITPLPGMVVNAAYAETTAATSTSARMAGAIATIPQQTDGTQLLTVSITPKSATNKLRIHAVIPYSCGITGGAWFAFFKDSAAPAVSALILNQTAGFLWNAVLDLEIVAGTTSPVAIKLRYGTIDATYTVYINSASGTQYMGGSQRAVLEILEIQA